MRLYELKAKNNDTFRPWFDKVFGVVVRAETEEDARELASKNCGQEGSKAWLSDELTSCTALRYKGKSGCIITDYRSA